MHWPTLADATGWLLLAAGALGAIACVMLGLGRRAPRFASRSALTLAALLGATGWCASRMHHDSPSSLARLTGVDSADRENAARIVTVEGVLTENPRGLPTPKGALGRFTTFDRSPNGKSGTRFWLDVRGVVDPDRAATGGDATAGGDAAPGALVRRATGSLWVRLQDATPATRALHAGDRVRLTGRLSPVRPRSNVGEPDGRLSARARAIVGTLEAPVGALVVRADHPEGLQGALASAQSGALRLGAWVRKGGIEWLRGGEEVQSRGPGDALLPAMLLGANESGNEELRAAFTRVGVAHVLAISGFNLTILSLVTLYLVRGVFGSASRWSGVLEPFIVCAVVVSYTLLLPTQAPILRAAAIAVTVTLAEAAGRRYDRLNTLGWTLAALTLAWPTDAGNPGFQLSFACVAALTTIAPRVRARWFGERIDPDDPSDAAHIRSWAHETVSNSVAVWGVATPIIACHFGAVAWLAPISAFIAVPLASVLMIMGYIAAALAALVPTVGGWLGPLLRLGAEGLTRVILALDSIPYATIRLPSIHPSWAMLAAAVFLWWALAPAPGTAPSTGNPAGLTPRAARARFAMWARRALCAVLAVWLIIAWRTDGAPPPGVVARVDTLSVGSGTCHLVRVAGSSETEGSPSLGAFRTGESALWDCGSSYAGAGLRDIPRACRALGAATVRTIVISHPDLDHYVALPDAARALGTRRVIVGASFFSDAEAKPDGPAATALRLLHVDGVELLEAGAGEVWPIGAGRLTFVSPPRGMRPPRSDNDASLVAQLTVGVAGDREASVLFTGDIEAGAMRRLLTEQGRGLASDILEMPHHGSGATAGAAGLRFVEAVNPSVILQSTDASREDDSRWAAARIPGRAWWVTSRDGGAWAEIRPDGSITSGALRRGASVP